MTLVRHLHRAREDRGAVMVAFAVFLPTVVLLASFVLDIGNWFEHRRHLQMQADAAVLAAGGEFPAAGLDSCSTDVDNAIDAVARNYGGIEPTPDVDNRQVGGTPLQNVLYALNSPTWPSQPEDVDPDPPDGGWGTPCETGVVDVKLAEQELPWFFKVAQLSFINAHARVQLQRAERASGLMPVGLPDINPTAAQAFFVDEAKTPGSAGYVLAATKLCRNGTVDGTGEPLWGNGGSCSDPNEVAPVPIPVGITVRDVGVRLALAGKELADCDSTALDACYTNLCEDDSPITVCYDTGSDDGLVHIRGWSDEQALSTSPRARSVRLEPGSCPDGYFVHPDGAPLDADGNPSCAVGVRARVDFGTTSVQDLGATVTANGKELTYDATDDVWISGSSSRVPVIPGGGPVGVELKWSITTNADGTACSGNGCSGTLGTVQRSFAATADRSGPIKGVLVAEHLPEGGIVGGANSFRRCGDPDCVHTLSVTIRLEPSLRDIANGPTDPPVQMRLVGSGSLTQALDCDDTTKETDDHVDANDSLLKSEIAFGCSPQYEINQGDPCPTTDLWDTPQPWDCVKTEQGAKTQDIVRGMNKRINDDWDAPTCLNPDRWEEYWADGVAPTQEELANDPRLVQVFLTPFGAFDDSGQNVFPVTQFAAFYVRNYTGQGGNENPCPSNAPAEEGGALVGHFVKYLDLTNNGEGSGEACSFDSLEICVPVLTK